MKSLVDKEVDGKPLVNECGFLDNRMNHHVAEWFATEIYDGE